jgi:hypothetical protein
MKQIGITGGLGDRLWKQIFRKYRQADWTTGMIIQQVRPVLDRISELQRE